MRATAPTLLLLTAAIFAPGCALIDGLTGDPADTKPDAAMTPDLDMSPSPDADMSTEEDTPPDSPPSDMDMDLDPDISLDMPEDMIQDMNDDLPDMMDMSPTPAEPPQHTIAVGSLSTCALKANKVYCWGDNNNGLLGVGSMARQVITPTQVSLGADAVAITGGSAHVCALLVGGALKCWGDGGQGRLGDNNTTARAAPVQVTGLTQGVRAVDAGAGFTCALLTSGGLQCWGANFSNQLGNGQSGNKPVPAQVFGMEAGVTTFSAGASHTCAVHNGALKCWGDNEQGQVGDGTSGNTVNIPTAVKVLGTGVTAVSAGGQHTCAIQSGALYCWGQNVYGQLGVEDDARQIPTPTLVPGMEQGVTEVSAGANHTCAIKGGELLCWGHDDTRQLGTGRPNPKELNDRMLYAVQGFGDNTSEVVAGDTHTCAWRAGALSCWGANLGGQLAKPTLDDRIIPTPILPLGASPNSFTALHTSRGHTCGVTGGAAACWGDGFWGELGDGEDGDDYKRAQPAPVTGLDMQVSAISAGDDHACGIKDGVVYCWGRNASGQLGDGTSTDRLAPVEPRNLRLNGTATHVATGESHSCAVVAGAVYCWGNNASNQLGVQTSTQREPNLVTSLSAGVTALVASSTHTCAIKDGALYCWGRNLSGQLGTGGMANVTTPTVVTGLNAQVSAVATGSAHTCAIHQDTVKCWGDNSRGQLGDNSTVARPTPGPVMGLSGTPTLIAVGDQHSCAALPSGVRCWGNNTDGQLGNNDQNPSPMNRLMPDPVAGPAGSAIQLTAAAAHTCAVWAGGAGLCWGDNMHGQLGSGQGTSLGPVPVVLP